MRRWLEHWRNRFASQRPPTVEVQSIFGPLTAFAGDFATRQIEQFGAHTRNEVALLRSFVNVGDLIYDVGAHIGTFAIPLALAAGENGRVVAIEADTESLALLRQNLDSSGLQSRVTPHLGIAGGRDISYRRVDVPRHTSATYFVPDPEGAAMPVIALDDLADRSSPPRRVAMIKIDVEGMELAVLRSAVKIIGRDRPILYVEISIAQMARYDVTLPEVAAFLAPYDYRCFRNIGDRNSTHDGFELAELGDLHEGGEFYDLLAVPADRIATFGALAPFAKR
jgi:FkbM family methyltransferase